MTATTAARPMVERGVGLQIGPVGVGVYDNSPGYYDYGYRYSRQPRDNSVYEFNSFRAQSVVSAVASGRRLLSLINSRSHRDQLQTPRSHNTENPDGLASGFSIIAGTRIPCANRNRGHGDVSHEAIDRGRRPPSRCWPVPVRQVRGRHTRRKACTIRKASSRSGTSGCVSESAAPLPNADLKYGPYPEYPQSPAGGGY